MLVEQTQGVAKFVGYIALVSRVFSCAALCLANTYRSPSPLPNPPCASNAARPRYSSRLVCTQLLSSLLSPLGYRRDILPTHAWGYPDSNCPRYLYTMDSRYQEQSCTPGRERDLSLYRDDRSWSTRLPSQCQVEKTAGRTKPCSESSTELWRSPRSSLARGRICRCRTCPSCEIMSTQNF